MGVSREAAGLPWKRETTMERGGCHYSNDEQLGQLIGAKQLESSTTSGQLLSSSSSEAAGFQSVGLAFDLSGGVHGRDVP